MSFLYKESSNELVNKVSVRRDCWPLRKEENAIAEFGIKTSEQGAERTKVQNKGTKLYPFQLSLNKNKYPFPNVITVHKCTRHTVFATLAPKTILYNFNNSIIENKESGKTFKTLPTQCQSSLNRVIVNQATLNLGIKVFHEWKSSR